MKHRKGIPYGPRTPIDVQRFKYPPQPHYTVHDGLCDYSRERLINKGKDCKRAWGGFNLMMADFIDPKQAMESIEPGQIENYIAARLMGGSNPLTVRRELVFLRAAIHHAHRRNRIKLTPYIEVPDGISKYRRPLTEDEFHVVISKPMSERLRRYYWVAYYTGQRSEAIEELAWDRVNLERREIDFNVPGRRITNKKRAADFPIIDDFMTRLVAWKARPNNDALVIGAGYSTFREAAYVVRKLCGLNDPTLVPRHCMRKKLASDLIAKGVNIEIVSHLTADDPKTLRSNYITHPRDKLMAGASVLSRTN